MEWTTYLYTETDEKYQIFLKHGTGISTLHIPFLTIGVVSENEGKNWVG